jgi:hypothetical protein
MRDLIVVDDLLAGKIVRGTWKGYSGHVTPQHARDLLNEYTNLAGGLDGAISLWQKNEGMSWLIAGHELQVGPNSTYFHSARLKDPAGLVAAVAAAAPDASINVEFVSGNVDALETWLGAPEERPAN